MKYVFICLFLCISCKNDKHNTENKINIIEIRDGFLTLYKNRNPKPVNKLPSNYLDSLTKLLPPEKDNIDLYYQIDFFLGFLDTRFNNELFESQYYEINESKEAYAYQENDFFNYDDPIILLENVLSKKNDSLFIKYYLPEHELNNMLVNNRGELKNTSYYNNLLKTLQSEPLNIKYWNFEKLVTELNQKYNIVNQWQGTYSFEYGRTQMGETSDYRTSFKINPDGKVEAKTTGEVYIDKIDDEGNAIGQHLDRKINRDDAYTITVAKQDTLKIQHNTNKEEIHVFYKNSEGNYFLQGSAYLVPAPDTAYLLTKSE